jgi:hypothetical protein
LFSVFTMNMITLDEFQFEKTEINEEDIKKFDSENGFMHLAVELLKEVGIITTVNACTFRFDENNNPRKWSRNEAISGGLMVRITKLQSSFLDQVCQNRMESAMILFRCIGESLINIHYLLKNESSELYDKFIEYSLREEKRLLNNINDNISKRGPELPIEKRMKKSITRAFQTSNFKVEDVDENNMQSWEENIYKRAKSVGLGNMYSGIFSLPSHYVHGNWQDLMSNHLEFENGEFSPNPDWNSPRPQPLLALCMLSIDANKLYINKTLPDCPDRRKISDLLDDIRSRTVIVDRLHEEFLQK